jgi:hypothetical protein
MRTVCKLNQNLCFFHAHGNLVVHFSVGGASQLRRMGKAKLTHPTFTGQLGESFFRASVQYWEKPGFFVCHLASFGLSKGRNRVSVPAF